MRYSLLAITAALVPALGAAQPPAGQPPAGQPPTGQPPTGTQQDTTRAQDSTPRTDSAGTRRRGRTGTRARPQARDSAGTRRDSSMRTPGSTTPPQR